MFLSNFNRSKKLNPGQILAVKNAEDLVTALSNGETGENELRTLMYDIALPLWINNCYVCHRPIEDGEETITKTIDPITNLAGRRADGSVLPPIASQQRHAYHESFTQRHLGFSPERDAEIRGRFRK